MSTTSGRAPVRRGERGRDPRRLPRPGPPPQRPARGLLRRPGGHPGAAGGRRTRWRTTCSITTPTPTGTTPRATRPTRPFWPPGRRVADFLGARADEIVFGANMTTLTFHLGRALGRGFGTRRRDRGDRARPPRERGHLAGPRARPRGRGARGPHGGRAKDGSTWPTLRSALSPRTRLLAIGAASQRPRHHQRRAVGRRPGPGPGRPRLRRRRPLRAPRAWSTCGPSAATSWPAPPTSSTGRTWACSTAATTSCAASTCPSWSRPPTKRPSAWRPAPRTTKASWAPPRRWTSWPPSARGPRAASGSPPP